MFLMFHHGNAKEPAKHIPVVREADDRDVRFAPDLVEQALVRELVNNAVVDDVRTRLALQSLSARMPLSKSVKSFPENEDASRMFSRI